MPITVGELLTRKKFKLTTLVSGDLDRAIRWVHSTEMPDPSGYLRGDEIVLSAGIWYWAGASPRVFAQGLAAANAAAIGFGLSPLVASVPEELVEACRELGLTLFTVPDDVPFIAISAAFIDRYVEDHERPLIEAEQRNRQLVAAAQRRKGVRGVLRILTNCRPGPSWVLDHKGQAMAWMGPRPAPETVARVAAAIEDADGIGTAVVDGWSAMPIVGTESRAHLVVAGDVTSEPVSERGVIEQALAFLAIEFQTELAVREAQRRFAAELFDLIAAGDGQLPTVSARLQAFGIDPNVLLVALACEVDGERADPDVLDRVLDDLHLNGVSAVSGRTLTAVVEWNRDEGDLREGARRIHAALGDGSCVGVGGVAEGVRDLRRSLVEARQACRSARRTRGGRGYASHADIGSHTLLLSLQDESVLSAFRDALLQPLIDHDARRNADLLRTLRTFLELGGAYQPTASRLHIHVNTLRLRLARIEELTGRALSEMETRVDFFIALRSQVGG